jgi:hypothetical protein
MPRRNAPSRRWRHAIRALDPESRVRLRELDELEGFDGRHLVARLRGDHWELRAGDRRSTGTTADAQRRVNVPIGIRRQLGADGEVLVSLACNRSRLVISSSACLDQLLDRLP